MMRVAWMVVVLLLATLMSSGCRPMVPETEAQETQEATMGVVEQLFEAYEDYDREKILSLHTDDAVWTWIDPGKNFPVFGPEGRQVGVGKEAILAMFDSDRGELGFAGYILFSEAQGATVRATEFWANDYARAICVPLITQSTYRLRDGKIAEWEWIVSPASSWRLMNTPNVPAANRQLMATINEEIWNQGKLELIDTHYAQDYVRHEAGYPGEMTGRAGLRRHIENLRSGFPDWNCTTSDVVAEGDKVVVRYLCTGTHTGEWSGLPPTGKSIEVQSIVIHRITDGKVAEDWSEYDTLGFMQQLGFELASAQ
jgi:steroid delta-isomerase-like uncharacterized protein